MSCAAGFQRSALKHLVQAFTDDFICVDGWLYRQRQQAAVPSVSVPSTSHIDSMAVTTVQNLWGLNISVHALKYRTLTFKTFITGLNICVSEVVTTCLQLTTRRRITTLNEQHKRKSESKECENRDMVGKKSVLVC